MDKATKVPVLKKQLGSTWKQLGSTWKHLACFIGDHEHDNFCRTSNNSQYDWAGGKKSAKKHQTANLRQNSLKNHGGDVLSAIDERFDDLEETVAALQEAVFTLQQLGLSSGLLLRNLI